MGLQTAAFTAGVAAVRKGHLMFSFSSALVPLDAAAQPGGPLFAFLIPKCSILHLLITMIL